MNEKLFNVKIVLNSTT